MCRMPDRVTGRSSQTQPENWTPTAPSLVPASRRPGPTMRLVDLPRRYCCTCTVWYFVAFATTHFKSSLSLNQYGTRYSICHSPACPTFLKSQQQFYRLSHVIGCCATACPVFSVSDWLSLSQAQQETQKAALSYERAVSMHTAAREMVYVAEQGLMADGRNTLDPTWQEMLNHATSKVTGEIPDTAITASI